MSDEESKSRIAELEEALKPFAQFHDAVEQNLQVPDERWALINVRGVGITYGELKKAADTYRRGKVL